MRCKPGDLAVYVGRVPEAHGQITKIVAFSTHFSIGHLGGIGPCWHVDPPIRHTGCDWWFAQDGALRPIRDNDGADETLAWVGKPESIEA